MSTGTTADEPAPPSPPPAATRRWWRSPEDRYVAGVAGGIAERLDVDPLFLRVALVAGTLLTLGDATAVLVLLTYGAAWLLLPRNDEASIVRRMVRDGGARREAAGVVVLVLAAALLLGQLGADGSGGLRWGVVLLALAAMLLVDRHGDEDPPPSRRAGGAPGGPGVDLVDEASGTTPTAASGEPVSTVEPSPAVRRWRATPLLWVPTRPAGRTRPSRLRPSRPGPFLWPLTVAALVILAVACFALDRLLDPGLRPGVAVNGALLVVGAVLLVSAWRGRARRTILLGLALLPLWLGLGTSGIDRFEGSGSRVVRPRTAEAAAGRHELGYGLLQLDLRDVDLRPGQELRTGVALTAGVADVLVPMDTNVVVRGRAGLSVVHAGPGEQPMDYDQSVVVDGSVRWETGPRFRMCEPQAVPTDQLSFGNRSFDSVEALTDELEQRGWDPPRPGPPDAYSDSDTVIVPVDDGYRLCDPSLPPVPDDPPTIVLDNELGLATLEISRVHTN